MYQRKQRRFRRNSNGRNQSHHGKGSQGRMRPNTFTNGISRNNIRAPLSAEKLFEKYSSLAKEAMSSGDKTLSENYLQHADHFMRIIEDKNRNQNQNRINLIDKPTEENKKPTDSDDTLNKSEEKK